MDIAGKVLYQTMADSLIPFWYGTPWDYNGISQKPGNGKIACEMTSQISYNMILMDIQMPVMNGYLAAEHIRASATPNRSIPIIALTASVMAIEHNKAIESGMDDLLSKPFTPDDLKKKIEKYYTHAKTVSFPEKEEIKSNVVEIDAKVIENVYNGDSEFQKIVFESFAEEITPQFEALRNAYDTKDIATVGSAAHQMKPTFGMVGLPKYQNDLEAIEKTIKAKGNLPAAEEKLLKNFFNDFPNIITAI